MKLLTRKHMFIALLIGMGATANAQWTDLGTFNQVIDDILPYNGNLHIVGNFTKLNGNTCYWSAYYNGSSIVAHETPIGGTGLNRLEVFDGDLYGTGGLTIGGGTGVSVWNGASWDDAGGFNTSFAGIYADGNDLYVGSDFGKVYKKTGNGNFNALTDFGPNDKMDAFAKFNGMIVVGGNFNAVGGTDYHNIAAWNGSAWTTLGTGLNGRVRCMAVFNNELYVGGDFSQAGGQNAQYVAKWNGSAWSAVGGSVTTPGFNGIRDMTVFNNRLYVAGDFTKIGNATTKYVAFWNGNSWSGLSLDVGDQFPNCIGSYNGKIYVGTFNFTASHLYRFDGTVAAGEPENILQVNCFPNPAADVLNVAFDAGNVSRYRVKVADNTGKTVVDDATFQQTATYDCSAWAPGMYHVVLLDPAKQRMLARQTVIKR